jgi:CHAD domain-containing protein
MEPPRLRQSNTASLPPPAESVVPAMLKPPDAISPVPASRTALGRSPNGNAAQCLPTPSLARRTNGAHPTVPGVGLCLINTLEARWKSYRQQLRRCQDQCSEEAVHELRVATRRLIAHLVLISCTVGTPALDKARRVLKRRLAALSDLRDTHVQVEFISHHAAGFPELGLLRKSLEHQERRLVKVAAGKVGSWKTRKIERWLDIIGLELAAKARSPRAHYELAPAVLNATADAFAQTVKRRQAIDLADLRTIHQTRVAFKRFRYMVESLSPEVTGLSKRELRNWAYYQRKMGIIQDLEVLQACVNKHLQENKGAEVLLRRFEAYLRRRRARALRSFLKTADRLSAFWPPAELIAGHEPAPTRCAA